MVSWIIKKAANLVCTGACEVNGVMCASDAISPCLWFQSDGESVSQIKKITPEAVPEATS